MRVASWAFSVLGLVSAFGVSGCFNTTIDKGPYGDYCSLAPAGEHHCGICQATSQCVYCPDVNGRVTCSADVCKSTCDSTGSAVPLVSGGGGGAGGAGGPATAGSGGTGGGGAGGSSGGGVVCNSECPAQCPADAEYQCSQFVSLGNCSVQSCGCFSNTPTAYCGVFYRSSTGAFWWCGGGYNEACSAIGVQQCAATVAAACQ
jgi:hypothetical protein